MNLVMAKPRSISLVTLNMSSDFSSRVVNDSESSGNFWGWIRQCSHTWTRVHTQPDTLVETRTVSRRTYLETGTKKRRRKFLETRAKEREFALDMLLETEAECRHIQIRKKYRAEPDASFFETSFPESADLLLEVGNHGRIISQRAGTIKTNLLIWRLFMSASMRAAIHLGQNYTENTSSLQKRACGRDREFIQHNSEIGGGKFWRDPGCEGHRQQWPIMGKNISSTGDQVDKGKSPRILRLGLMCGKNVCTSRSSGKLERAADRFANNSF